MNENVINLLQEVTFKPGAKNSASVLHIFLYRNNGYGTKQNGEKFENKNTSVADLFGLFFKDINYSADGGLN